ncbi:MAG: SAM-dependent methyltransferase, partial [Pseudomonadota bacterium]
TEIRDVVANPPAPSSFDVITVSRFLERNLIPHLIKALRPSGLMFYQTFTRIRVDDSGPKSPGFRLADNELLSLFQELRVLAYQEVGAVGSTAQGLRNEAILVGQKR